MKKKTHEAIATAQSRKAYYLTDAEAALIEHFRWEMRCESVNGKDRLKIQLCCLRGTHFLYGRIKAEDGYCHNCRSTHLLADGLKNQDWAKVRKAFGLPEPNSEAVK